LSGSEGDELEVVVLVGPTAVGKSRVAMELAPLLNAEIVSADSVQVYRYMDLGTAKPPAEDRARVPHHLLDVVDPDQPYDVVQYRRQAREALEEIAARGKLPLVVGGTGFYVRALLREGELPPQGADATVRERLEADAERHGNEHLLRRLQEVDPEGAARIDRHNRRRLVRALEVYETTGRPQSSFRGLDKGAPLRYNAASFGLTMPREQLHRVIDDRVDQMVAAGFDREVQSLLDRGYSSELPSLQALGYRQWLLQLEGRLSRDEALSLWKRDTRRYARRQLTWFRAEPVARWLEVSPDAHPDQVVSEVATDCLQRRRTARSR